MIEANARNAEELGRDPRESLAAHESLCLGILAPQIEDLREGTAIGIALLKRDRIAILLAHDSGEIASVAHEQLRRQHLLQAYEASCAKVRHRASR